MSENYQNQSEKGENLKNLNVESTVQEPQKGTTIIVNQERRETNGIGTAGFVISIVAIFLGWIPFVGWIIWLLGLVFSFVGIFRNPKGLSIAGLVISLVGIILLLFFFGAILAAAGFSK